MCAQQFGRDKTFDDYEELEKAILKHLAATVNIDNWRMLGASTTSRMQQRLIKSKGPQVNDVFADCRAPGTSKRRYWRRWLYNYETEQSTD